MKAYHESDVERGVFLIHRVGRLLRQRGAELLAEAGVNMSPEQWSVLRRLATGGPATLSGLADPHLNDRPNLTRMVEALVRKGLAQRGQDPADRRLRRVSLTPAGLELVRRTMEGMVREKEKVFTGIAPAEVAALVGHLERLETNLTAEELS